jgi:S-adenosylmethionine:tRNA ribosyltransferase-isomerase
LAETYVKTTDFDYHLPPERIAQTPVEPRHSSRLLVYHRKTDQIEHRIFYEIGEYLNPGDLLVVNDTRVIPARIYGHKLPSGGKVEILLLKKTADTQWETLVGGKGLKTGREVEITEGLTAKVIEELEGSHRMLEFSQPVEPFLQRVGNIPLPPYIHTPLADPERYQTVYAKEPGSAAAPTAGLHFTPELIEQLKAKGIGFTTINLHVGLDTFAPVTEEDPAEHQIHTEWCEVTPKTAQLINNTARQGGRIIAVGTTSVRTLESAGRAAGLMQRVGAFSGPTSLYILPGYSFKVVDAIITNFHLPKSTLIMLISAFTSREKILSLYDLAVREKYRFYSFGDAMFIE